MLIGSRLRKAPQYACWISLAMAALSSPAAAQCVDYSKDPAGCQPSTFDTPIGQMPSVRVNRDGKLDPTASEADARAGVAKLEKELHLFRNMEHLHWVLTVPSVKDPATGAWKGGDLEAAGDGRGLGIAGNCIFTGHANGAGRKHAINIFKIQSNPEKQPPVQVGEIPATCSRRQSRLRRSRTALAGLQNVRRRGSLHPGSNRRDQHHRSNGDLPHRHEYVSAGLKSETTDFGVQSHEFFLWHDPANSNRVLDLHDQLDLRTAGPRSSWSENAGFNRARGHRRRYRRDVTQGEGTGNFHPSGSWRSAGEREARRHRLVLGRTISGFQRQQKSRGPRGKLPEQRAKPAPLNLRAGRWRAGLRGRHNRRIPRSSAGFGGNRAS